MSNNGAGAPTSPFSDEQLVNWLIDECRDVSGRVAALSTSGDRILGTGTAVVALAATVAVGGGKGYLLMWLPVAVAIVIVHGLYMNNLTKVLVGYQRGLEDEIARRVGVPVIAWESRILRHTSNKSLIKGVLGTGAAVYVASVGVGISQAWHTRTAGAWGHERAWLYLFLTIAGSLAGAALIAYCYGVQRGAQRQARARTTALFQPPATQTP